LADFLPAGLFKELVIAARSAAHAREEGTRGTRCAGRSLQAGLLRRDARASADDRLRVDRYAVGLAAWILDHDEDSYEKISRAFLEGNVTGGLTPERVVDNITLHWLTNTAASSARLYWENFRAIFAALAAGKKPASLSVPVAFTVFPSENLPGAAQLGREGVSHLIYFNEAEKGGHFAAWEEPEIFARELRAAFSSLR